MAADLRFDLLADSEGDRFRQFFDIYASSLPAREQKSRSEIAAMLHRRDYRIYLLENGAEVLGFSILFLAEREPMALLEYMATRADQRNAGLGARAFQAGLAAVAGRRLLVEVDSPREDSPDRAIRERRQRFYGRQGCLLIQGLPYVLPLPGEGKPPLMDLMLHLNGDSKPVSRERLQSWLGVIYEAVYGQSPGDRRIATMLRDVSDPITLL
jgi:hypothetical protein